MTIAAEQGVLTMRPLAAAAGTSLEIVHYHYHYHYHFHDNDTLLTHLGETQILQVNVRMRLAFEQYTEPAGLTGIPALEDLLRAGIHGLWPIIESTPNHQLLTYEITAHALRQRSAGNVSAGAIAQRQCRTMDAETVAFLTLCAARADVTWTIPVEQVARCALTCMNGLVLHWLVDRDSDATLTALDDLAAILTTKAHDPQLLPGGRRDHTQNTGLVDELGVRRQSSIVYSARMTSSLFVPAVHMSTRTTHRGAGH